MARHQRVRFHLAIAVLLAALGAGSSVAGQDEQGSKLDPAVSVSGLRPGDTLRISFASSGCFYSMRSEVVILGSDPDIARVTLWELGPVLGTANDGPKRRTVRLSQADRDGLDRLLAYYRSAPTYGCTSVDRIEITLSRRGKKDQKQSFVDGSCHAGEVPGVVTLDEIVRIRPAIES